MSSNPRWDTEIDQPLMLQIVLEEQIKQAIEPIDPPKDIIIWEITKIELGFSYKDMELKAQINNFLLSNENFQNYSNQQ